MGENTVSRTTNTLIRKTLLTLAMAAIAGGQAQAEEDAGAADSAPVIVTATRFDASIDTAPVNIITISAEDIANSGANNIYEVLRYQAGVKVSSLYGINGARSKLDLGGFGQNGASNTLILINGRRLNDLDLASANLATIPLDSIERIEIVQGSASVLYGDNAVSGVINIVTKSALDGESGNLALEAGSFETRRLTAGLQKMLSDTALSVNVEGLRSDGYRDHNAIKNATVAAELSREDSGWLRGIRYQQSYENIELPGSINEAAYEQDPTQAGSSPSDVQTQRYAVEGFIDSDGLAAEVALRNKQWKATSSYGVSQAELETLSATPRLRRQYGNHRMIAGLDIYQSTLDASSTWNAQYVTQKSNGLYLTDAIALGKSATLNLGIRRQLIEVRAGNVTSGSNRRSDGITTWDISLSRKHNYGATNYLRLARSFRAPVMDEMWNYTSGIFTLIKPQTARHYEIGTRQTWASGARLNASLFRINLEDEIGYEYASFSNINRDKTRRDGVNLDLKAPVGQQASLQASYAWRKAVYRDGPNDGKEIPLVPRNKFTLGGQYAVTGDTHLGINAIYTGNRYFGDDNANAGKKLGGYTRVDMNYRHRFGHWDIRLLVQNLTNVKASDFALYRPTTPASYHYYPLPERAFYLQLGAAF